MDTFAPEFSKFWLPESAGARRDAGHPLRDEDTGAQKAALEELAERVSAARSIV
ncbi:MAG: hypothetical protein ABI593_18175 [Betaproteobacteria bacterium]